MSELVRAAVAAIVEGRTLFEPRLELRRPGTQRRIVERLELRLEGVDLGNDGAVLLEQALVAAAEDRSQ